MRSTVASLRANIWVKMFWAIVLYLALVLVPAFLVMLVLHKTVGEITGPYLAYAVPGPIFLLVILWLRTWEERGASPRQVALVWSLCTTLFMFLVFGATVYSGVELHLIDPNDAVGTLVVGCVGGALVGPLTTYRHVLKIASARTAKRIDGAHPN
jgi:hypothetical protein